MNVFKWIGTNIGRRLSKACWPKKPWKTEKDDDKKQADQKKKCIALIMDLQAVKVNSWVQASVIFYKT